MYDICNNSDKYKSNSMSCFPIRFLKINVMFVMCEWRGSDIQLPLKSMWTILTSLQHARTETRAIFKEPSERVDDSKCTKEIKGN